MQTCAEVTLPLGHHDSVWPFPGCHISGRPGLFSEPSFNLYLPNEKPSWSKWKMWLEFWMAVAGPGGSLNQPLGEWVGLTHRKWTWFYRPHEDIMYRRQDNRIEASTRSATQQVRSGQTYRRSHIVGNLPQPALTAHGNSSGTPRWTGYSQRDQATSICPRGDKPNILGASTITGWRVDVGTCQG